MVKLEQGNQQTTTSIVNQISEINVQKQLSNAYNKLNSELSRLMGPELKKCIDQNSDDPRKIVNCYDQFHKRISPVLEKLGVKTAQTSSTLQKCLQSKENAKVCAKIGLEKSNQYINEAFNDLKSYLA